MTTSASLIPLHNLAEQYQNPLVAYHHPPNLRNLLVRATCGQLKETHRGNSRCRQPHCKTCAHMKLGITFHNTTTGEKVRVKATADCRTSNVIYLIKCKKCSVQYVRETENILCVRRTGHRSDINHHRIEKAVARHFNLSDHSMVDLGISQTEGKPLDHSNPLDEARRTQSNHMRQLPIWSNKQL